VSVVAAPARSAAEAPHASAESLPPFPDAATLASAPRGRPAPTRAATLAAYRNALQAAAPPPAAAPLAPAAAIAAPAIAPVLAVARWPKPPPMSRPPTLARVQTDAPPQNGAEPQAAKSEPPDLDALTDHVLERLRHELRDGRERLGYLLDDLR
jgi:hypothetical protein